MRAPGTGRTTRFRVFAHLDGAQEATVTIRPMPGGFLFDVRPKGRRASYTLALGNVAEMVAWRVAKIDAVRGRA
jgi:hypothetical protein